MTHPLIPRLTQRGLPLRASIVLSEHFASIDEVDAWILRTTAAARRVELKGTPHCGIATAKAIETWIDRREEQLANAGLPSSRPPTSEVGLLREALLVLNLIPNRSVIGLAHGTTYELAAAITRCIAEEDAR